MPQSIVSFNQVVKAIAEKHNSYANGDIYSQLREMITSGVLEGEGIMVFEQPTKMGSHGKTYHFDDCNRVVECWESLYATPEVLAGTLLVEIRDAIDGNLKLKAQFPNYLLRKLLKYTDNK